MNKVPEDFTNTDKLLYLRGLDGESQVPLMKKLAEIAQELYKEKWFYALIPFGSRTRGLSEQSSDIDILIIVSNLREAGGGEIVREKLGEKNIKGGSVYVMRKARYIECLTSENGTEVECNVVAGIILGPNKLERAREQIHSQTAESKGKVINHILDQIFMAGSFRRQTNSNWSDVAKFREPTEGRIGDRENKGLYIKNRLRLWERRIRHLLDYRGDL